MKKAEKRQRLVVIDTNCLLQMLGRHSAYRPRGAPPGIPQRHLGHLHQGPRGRDGAGVGPERVLVHPLNPELPPYGGEPVARDGRSRQTAQAGEGPQPCVAVESRTSTWVLIRVPHRGGAVPCLYILYPMQITDRRRPSLDCLKGLPAREAGHFSSSTNSRTT